MTNLSSNFDQIKENFKNETGLDWEKNIENYIKYFEARVSDELSYLKKFLSTNSNEIEPNQRIENFGFAERYALPADED